MLWGQSLSRLLIQTHSLIVLSMHLNPKFRGICYIKYFINWHTIVLKRIRFNQKNYCFIHACSACNNYKELIYVESDIYKIWAIMSKVIWVATCILGKSVANQFCIFISWTILVLIGESVYPIIKEIPGLNSGTTHLLIQLQCILYGYLYIWIYRFTSPPYILEDLITTIIIWRPFFTTLK